MRLRNSSRILLPAVAVSGGISFLLTIGATIRVSVRESLRLGGPVFKLTRLFRALEEGSSESDSRKAEASVAGKRADRDAGAQPSP